MSKGTEKEEQKPLRGADGKPVPQLTASDKFKLGSLIVVYCLVNSSLLVVNKLAVTYYPYPGTVLFAQLFFSALIAWAGGQMGFWTCDPLIKEKVIPSIPVVLAFFGVIFTNMSALRHVNVDTMIVFRTCIPFGVALFEYLLMDRELPSGQTWGALSIVAGTTAYMFSKEITLDFISTFWLFAWFAVASFDMLYLKKYCSSVELTPFGRVYYNNLLGCVPAVIMAVVQQEVPEGGFADALFGRGGAWVLVSCVLGFGLSLASWALRAQISALSFTVIGVLNKVLSVLLNASMWDRHSSWFGQIVVIAGIGGGVMYREPPVRKEPMGFSFRLRNFAIQLGAIVVIAIVAVIATNKLFSSKVE